MFPHAVIGIDFSPGGEVLIRSLPLLRSLGTEEITLLHSLDVTFPTEGSTGFEGAYRDHLRTVQERAIRNGYRAETLLTRGDPTVQVPRAARERDAQLIVVGSRSQNRHLPAFVGSIAWGILRESPVPVLVVRIEPGGVVGEQPFERVHPEFSRILFPTDGSDTAEQAFRHVEAIVGGGNIRKVSLLHVRSAVDEARSGRSTEAAEMEKLSALAQRLNARGASHVDCAAPSGSPYLEIVRRTQAVPGTLVVMGTHGRGFLGDAFLGGVTREVVRDSRSPVLVVPPGG